MIAFISSGEVIAAIIGNPGIIIKSFILILTVLYALFAIRVLVQIRRLERWLIVLRGYHFSVWAWGHVILVVMGIILTASII